ncbi:TPA: YceI family protein [Vibrio vulnificus]|uniref:YceI family protein n=1 Tax=Vibrio vulnificus TaxID=672 RepID=UPI0028BA4744|nr:YceI family protein [Vibrio vulnificus]EHY1123158.1 YceI family protein [Vibrio vulnificus]EIO3977835.1 YceI family protein [Vibrio vulnificus]HDY7473856.1 YceI family protein [Vibrio vulnificus]HDY7818723.1 YceI family protein [Vibrio vulnificus]
MRKNLSSLSIVLALFSGASLAADNYTLDSKLSSVSFATIKNQFVVEPATIDTLTGTLNSDGEFNVSVDLNSIETGIPIRNTRLNEIFFESAKHAPVRVAGKVDWTTLGQGSHKLTVPADVVLFGKTKSVEFPVVILNTSDTVMVSSSAPVIIGASDFGIPTENLTNLAATVGGIKISDRVPLTLNLTFKK